MAASDPSLRRPTVAVVGSILWAPVAVGLTAAFPEDARPAVFLAGVAVTSALALWGGIRARRILLEDTPAKARAAAVSWTGLTVGVTAGVFCFWGAIGLLA